TYLQGDERRAALALSRALRAVEQAWRGGEADPGPLARRGLEVLRAPGVAPEYLALVDEQMRPVAGVDARTAVLVAAKVGKTRLIDSVVRGGGVASDVPVGACACASPPTPLLVRRAARTPRVRGACACGADARAMA